MNLLMNLLSFPAIDCPDLPAPLYGWVKREGRVLTAGCNDDPEVKWKRLCKGIVWNGGIGNCTSGEPFMIVKYSWNE